jgi:hypothetical protein
MIDSYSAFIIGAYARPCGAVIIHSAVDCVPPLVIDEGICSIPKLLTLSIAGDPTAGKSTPTSLYDPVLGYVKKNWAIGA